MGQFQVRHVVALFLFQEMSEEQASVDYPLRLHGFKHCIAQRLSRGFLGQFCVEFAAVWK